MATDPLQAGTAPANAPVAPDFGVMIGDCYIIAESLKLLFASIDTALDSPPPEGCDRTWSIAASLAGLGERECARLSNAIDLAERAYYAGQREAA